jgi:hypothetical protein
VLNGFESIGDGQRAVDWLIKKYLHGELRNIGTKRECTSFGGSFELLSRAEAYVDGCKPAGVGCRNNSAFSIAGNLHALIGSDGERLGDTDVYSLLRRWNTRNAEPLSDRELQQSAINGRKNGSPPADKPPKNREPVDNGFTPKSTVNRKACDTTPEIPGKSEVLSQKSKTESKNPATPELHEFMPFPSEALPYPLSEFVRQAAVAMCCDESFIAMPLLAGLSAAIGTSYGLLIKRGWVVPSIIWSVVVAESGSGKSSPQRLALKPLHDRQRRLVKEYDEAFAEFERLDEIYQRDLANFKKAKDESVGPPVPPAEPICERVVVNDTTIEALGKRLKDNPRGVLCASDELSGWFGGFNKYSKGKGGDESKWLEFFNSQTSIIDRSSASRPLVIEKASVSITGTIQPAILRKCLTADYKASGLAARLLFAMPPRMQKRWTEDEVEELIEDEVAGVFDSLFKLELKVEEDGNLSTNLIRLEPTAKRLFVSYYNRHNREQQQLDGDLYAAYSKLEEYAARFALVIHCVRHALGQTSYLTELDCDSMSAGIQLCEWFKNEAKRVYAVLSESELASENRKLLNWLGAQEQPVAIRDFYRAHRMDAEQAELLLQQFVEAELGEWVNFPPTEQGGRPFRKFKVKSLRHNPKNPRENGGSVTNTEIDSENLPPLAQVWMP